MAVFRGRRGQGRPRHQGPGRSQKLYHLVVNLISGEDPEGSQNLARKLEHRLKRGDTECIIETAGTWEDFGRIVTESARRKPFSLVIFGGDRSVRIAAAHVVRTKGLLGIVPCGRHNSIFDSLYGSVDQEKAIEMISAGHQRRIDAGLANGHFFVGSLVSGLIPALLDRLGKDPFPRLSMSWSKLASQAAEDTIARPTTIKVDSYTFTAEPLILNVHLLSHLLTLRFAPAAMPDDGRLVLIYDQGGSRDVAAHYIRDLRKKKYQYTDAIHMVRGKRVSIAPASGRTWLMDGDRVEFSGNEVTVEVHNQVLRVYAHAPQSS